MPAIDLRGVGRRFSTASTEVRALTDVTFAIAPGEAVAIMGPSGSGKTTLLQLVSGLDLPTEGEVIVLGQRVDQLSEGDRTALRARSIGIVFQDPHLLAGLSVLDNVVAARLPWERRNTLEPRARELLTAVGLGDRLDFGPARLSGGERQRVALARALLGSQSILLADEPTGNLDAATTDEVVDLLDRLRAARDLTVIVATHDPAVAAFADRVIRLADGRLDGATRLGDEQSPSVRIIEA